jgi:tRNA(fMet)-specific endonuclease VapC
MRYLLDTNVVSDLIRNPQGRAYIKRLGEVQVCTSMIVAAELRYGATRKGSPRLTAQLEAPVYKFRALTGCGKSLREIRTVPPGTAESSPGRSPG